MASDFLWKAGTSNSGLLVSPVTLLSTEMNSLASAARIISSVGGSSGKFTNSDFGQGMWGELFLTLGAIGSTLSAGANLSGWFLTSPDSGSSLESLTALPPRAPDFIVPLPVATVSGGTIFKAMGLVQLPALQCKVLVQNNSGQTFASSANTLVAAPIAAQY